jgi:hypothetical protein
MFEVKCDVAGCEKREMLPSLGQGLPPGWRLVTYLMMHRRDPVEKKQADKLVASFGNAMAGTIGEPALGAAFKDLLQAATPPQMPFVERRYSHHMCPEHPLPQFGDSETGDIPPPDLGRLVFP